MWRRGLRRVLRPRFATEGLEGTWVRWVDVLDGESIRALSNDQNRALDAEKQILSVDLSLQRLVERFCSFQ